MESHGSTSDSHGRSSDRCSTFEYHSSIQGYHEYKSIWDASIGEVVTCNRKTDNGHDDYAVSVVCGGITVGHVHCHFSRRFSLFLDNGGNISATVVSVLRYSRDLPQGWLEIPCQYLLQGPMDKIKNVKKFVAACENNYKMIKPAAAVRSPKVETCAVKQEAEIPASCKPTAPLDNSTKEGGVNHTVISVESTTKSTMPYKTDGINSLL